MGKPVRVGVVLPASGRLADLADPLAYCGRRLADPIRRATGGRVELVWHDSRSDPVMAARAARELAADPRVVLVVTMAGTELVPAVAGACRAAGVPCLSTALPWQVYLGSVPGGDPAWGFHFCWGLGDIGAVFADLWRRAGAGARVGCLWNDGRQGEYLRDNGPTGFLAAAAVRGFRVHDPGGYGEGAADFTRQIGRLRAAGVTVVTSAATPADLGRFRAQAAADGWQPKLITCSRWLAYPGGVRPRDTAPDPDAAADVGTIVYWTPRHPYSSSVDATGPGMLAGDYRYRTGRGWLQPLGLAHALLEVAVHALSRAADPADRAAVAHTLSRTDLDTMAGRLDWTTGPAAGIARVPLACGQWQDHGGVRQLVVTDERVRARSSR